MSLPTDMLLERQGAQLTLRSTTIVRWRDLIVFVGFFALWFGVWWQQADDDGGLSLLIGVLAGVLMAVIGAGFIVQPQIVCTFNLDDRIIRYRRILFDYYVSKDISLTFQDIRRIGLEQHDNDGYSYTAFMETGGGERLKLSAAKGGYVDYNEPLEELRRATGIAKGDLA